MQIEQFKELLDEEELRAKIQELVGRGFDVFVSAKESSSLYTFYVDVTLVSEVFDRKSYMREEKYRIVVNLDTHKFYCSVTVEEADDDFNHRKDDVKEVVTDHIRSKFS